MRHFPGMQKGNLDAAPADEHGRIRKETVAAALLRSPPRH